MATKDRISQINCIVFKKENNHYKFLLLKRRKDRGGFWQAITGGVKQGEQNIDALKRELLEETGIAKYKRIINLNYSFSFNLPKFGDLTENCYAVKIPNKTKITISAEHTEYKWLILNEAISLLKYEPNKEAFRKLVNILNER